MALDAAPQDVQIYQTASGKLPLEIWLASLGDSRVRARIRVRVTRLQLGDLGDCKSLGGGVLELRLGFGPGYRIYFSRLGCSTVLLLCGGVKSSQESDIRKAREYWRDYRTRCAQR